MLATFRIQHGPFSSLKWQTQSQKATNSKIRKGESIVCKKCWCSRLVSSCSSSYSPCSCPSTSTLTSSTTSCLLSRFILKPLGGHHPDYWVLMELGLRVHQFCPGSFDPHPLVHLTDQARVEISHHFHGEFHPLSLMCNQAVLPHCIFLLFVLEGSLMLFSTTVAIATSLTLIGHL